MVVSGCVEVTVSDPATVVSWVEVCDVTVLSGANATVVDIDVVSVDVVDVDDTVSCGVTSGGTIAADAVPADVVSVDVVDVDDTVSCGVTSGGMIAVDAVPADVVSVDVIAVDDVVCVDDTDLSSVEVESVVGTLAGSLSVVVVTSGSGEITLFGVIAGSSKVGRADNASPVVPLLVDTVTWG